MIGLDKLMVAVSTVIFETPESVFKTTPLGAEITTASGSTLDQFLLPTGKNTKALKFPGGLKSGVPVPRPDTFLKLTSAEKQTPLSPAFMG